jgi:hypothetical protein
MLEIETSGQLSHESIGTRVFQKQIDRLYSRLLHRDETDSYKATMRLYTICLSLLLIVL